MKTGKFQTVLVYQIKVDETDIQNFNRGKSVPVIDMIQNLRCFGSAQWTSQNFIYFSLVAKVFSESENALEDAFMIMQRVDENHTPENNPAFVDLTGNNSYHSLSVGDILIVHDHNDPEDFDGKYYMVEGIGFKEIDIMMANDILQFGKGVN